MTLNIVVSRDNGCSPLGWIW